MFFEDCETKPMAMDFIFGYYIKLFIYFENWEKAFPIQC